MTYLYINSLPRDKSGEALFDFPAPVKAITSVVVVENNVTSSVMLLNPNTTSLEVNAIGGSGAAIRWVPASETAAVAPRGSVIASGLGANFDHFIPAGTFRRLAIPKETGGSSQPAGAQIGSVHGLYQRMAHINAGSVPSSVLIIQY